MIQEIQSIIAWACAVALLIISSGIYVNGVKFVPTVSGNNLIWTKQ